MNEEDVEEFALQDASQEELQEFQQYLRQQAPMPQEKTGIAELLGKIFKTKDTRKGGSVDAEDLAKMRIYLEGAEYFERIGATEVASWLRAQSEIIVSTSLSHKGEFLKAIITSKRDISLGEKKKTKRTFFGKPKDEGGGNI